MNKDERKYVAKRIAEEAGVVNSQVKTTVPTPQGAFEKQLKALPKPQLLKLFGLNLPRTGKDIAASVSIEGWRATYGRNNQQAVPARGDISGSIRLVNLLDAMQSFAQFKAAFEKDEARVRETKAAIRVLATRATDEVLLGSAPQALAALAGFKVAVAKFLP